MRSGRRGGQDFVSTRGFFRLPETNLSEVPWSFDPNAAFAPRQVVFASGKVFASFLWPCFKVDAVVFFLALEVPWGAPSLTVLADCFKVVVVVFFLALEVPWVAPSLTVPADCFKVDVVVFFLALEVP
jgi:hypothetical protein